MAPQRSLSGAERRMDACSWMETIIMCASSSCVHHHHVCTMLGESYITYAVCWSTCSALCKPRTMDTETMGSGLLVPLTLPLSHHTHDGWERETPTENSRNQLQKKERKKRRKKMHDTRTRIANRAHTALTRPRPSQSARHPRRASSAARQSATARGGHQRARTRTARPRIGSTRGTPGPRPARRPQRQSR